MRSARVRAPSRYAAVLWRWAVVSLALLVAIGSLVVAWKTQERVRDLELELVRRQQDAQNVATEARALAQQAQESSRDAGAKSALLEMRVAEVALQRSQLEELIQSLSRSRDENVLVDIEAAVRVALQQSSITGSAEPLVATLKQADERLARYGQPRLEGVRRAIARDLDRVKAVGVTDVSTLNIRLDEAVRLVDELPLLAGAEARRDPARGGAAPVAAASVPASASAAGAAAMPAAASAPSASAAPAAPVASHAAAAASAGAGAGSAWWSELQRLGLSIGDIAWSELRALVRVSRIDHPEAMLIAPDQAFFLRENLKLRLLNARLAVLSRQFDTAQADLQIARTALDRYFDRGSRKVAAVADLLKQVAAQARQVSLPRPDDTLAALAAANAGR